MRLCLSVWCVLWAFVCFALLVCSLIDTTSIIWSIIICCFFVNCFLSQLTIIMHINMKLNIWIYIYNIYFLLTTFTHFALIFPCILNSLLSIAVYRLAYLYLLFYLFSSSRICFSFYESLTFLRMDFFLLWLKLVAFRSGTFVTRQTWSFHIHQKKKRTSKTKKKLILFFG